MVIFLHHSFGYGSGFASTSQAGGPADDFTYKVEASNTNLMAQGGVAANLMAKMGFKAGKGLGEWKSIICSCLLLLWNFSSCSIASR